MKKILVVLMSIVLITTMIVVPVNAESSKIVNSSFKEWLNGWEVKGDTYAASGKGDWGYDDSNSLGYWSDNDYEVWTEQTITGIPNGYYKIEAYAASGGNQEAHYIYANDFGGTGARTSIPISNDFVKVVLDIEVTNNKVTVGFYAKGRVNTWSNYDCISITKVDEPYTFLKGGDLTMVNYIEDLGGTFYDENGEARDVFHLLAENGFNFARLRTHNDTGREYGSITNPDYYLPDGYQNTDDLLKSALRAKEVGMAIEVTLNYSDWWPNGSTQEIPSSWRSEIEGLGNDEAVDKLEELVYEYTKEVMIALVNQGTTPEFISLGNEMQHGILYPYGRVANFEQLARFLNAGYRAVKEVSTNTQVVLHLDEAGEDGRYTTFLDGCIQHNVNYDVIGSSYYPFWTRKNVEEIIPWFNDLYEKYGKKILIMETGYNWNPTKPDGWPGQLTDNGNESHESTPQGQKEFLDELFNEIKNAKDNCIIGDLYWDPVMISYEGVGWAMERGDAEDGSEDKAGDNVVSNTTLFDFNGNALLALKSFRDNTEGTTKGIASLVVTGNGGNKIIGASVTLNINGNEIKKITDKYGRVFVNDLSEGEITVEVSKDGYEGRKIVSEVVKGQVTNIEVVLGTGTITGKVTDTNNNNVEGATVYTDIDGVRFSALTNENGQYELLDLPAGTEYSIFAERQGFQGSSITGVDVEIGKSTSNIDFIINVNSGSIAGVITDINSNPVENVKIVAASESGKEYIATSKDDGSYEIKYLNSNDIYKITASKDGYFDGVVDNIYVENGQVTENINIQLESAVGSIYGVAVDSNNNKLSDVSVKVSLKDDVLFNVVTDDNGMFEIKNVIDGDSYLIEGSKEGFGDVILSNVSVEKCDRAEVVLRMSTPIEIENWDFETGTLDGWIVEGNDQAVTAQDRTNFGNDAPSGKYALSLWLDNGFEANIYQEVTGLKSGKYELSVWVYSGGDYNSDYIYINDNDNITKVDLGFTNGWKKIKIPVWIENESVEIGFDFNGNGGCWTVIDSVQFNYITSINYINLEDGIYKVKSLKEDEYTPKSWSLLNESILYGKSILIKPEVIQEEVNEAESKIVEAINLLVEKPNKEQLYETIQLVLNIEEDKYTEESYIQYKEALEYAKEVYLDENVTEDEVIYSISNLIDKYNNLTLKVEGDDNINAGGSDGGNDEDVDNKDDDLEIVIPDKEEAYGESNNSNKLPLTGGIDSSFIILIGGIAIVFGVLFVVTNNKKKNISE